MKNSIKRLIKWLNILVILITFLAYLAPYIPPKFGWFLPTLGMSFLWLVLLNCFFILIWLLLRSRYFLYSAICLLLGWNPINKLFNIPFTSALNPSGINILSYNCRQFYDFSLDKSTEEQTLKAITSKKADVICLQEFPRYRARTESLIKAIKDATGLNYEIHNLNGLAIFSKFPIAKKHANNTFIYFDLEINKRTIRIYNTHLQSNHVSDETNKMIEEKDLGEKRTWLGIKKILTKIKSNSIIRTAQAIEIKKSMKKSKHPIIICGDFNETPQSYNYNIMSEKLKDSFCESGSGIGSTYAGKIPGLRIDYILTDPSLKINHHEVVNFKVSDHYPIFSNISLE